MQMKCCMCGKEYESPRGRKTCSESCRKKRKYEQNKKRTPEHLQVGATCKCQICGHYYKRNAVHQKYCSAKCKRVMEAKYATAKQKTARAVCEICGAEFMTAPSVMARTCGKECSLRLRSKLAKERAGDNRPFTGVLDAYNMPDPWQGYYKKDVYWPPIRSGNREFPLMDCPENDPLSWQATGVCIDVSAAYERSIAA